MTKLTAEAKDFLGRVEDKADIVLRRHIEQVTEFVDPYLKNCACEFLKNISGINYAAYGGVDGAERQRIVICPDYSEPELSMAQLCLVEFTGKLDHINSSHRDFLGALLGQGIKRGKVGDLYPIENGFIVVISRELADFILLGPIVIKGVSLEAQILKPNHWEPLQSAGKIVNTTLASLRLDTVLANGFGISRTKVTSFIKGGKVKVNWQVVVDTDHLCSQDDVISFRGKGRIIVSNVSGETRKGRLKVTITRYE
ncbi:MAG: hypothetical protein VR72_19325 [Clostridiaceae bacterium BRH_c20a]|nr:MAG: hypothetical protein VR72_19325 [Clostridiaceae bacterium BRH_c20a]